jgi:competence protein ComEC
MFWAAATYSLGVLAGVYAWRPDSWWIAAAVAFMGAASYFVFGRPRFGWVLALGAFFLAGALQLQLRSARPRVDTSLRPFADRQELQIVAHALSDGHLQNTSTETRQTVDVETEEIQTSEGKSYKIRSGIRLGIYARRSDDHETQDSEAGSASETALRAIHYGDRIQFIAKLRLPRNFRNPGAFDYEGYLADRGIAALGSVKAENVQFLPGVYADRIAIWRSRLHRIVVLRVNQLWPAREAALINAMVIGEEAFIDRETRIDFQRSGTYHILVVSGMNVSILAFVVFWALRRSGLGELTSTLITIASCVAYAFLTDVGPPVWRAALMCAVYLCTRLLYRDRAMLNAIGTAALVLLLIDPRQILTASFQMTFVCVLIVAGIGVPILQRTSQLYRLALVNWDSRDFAAKLPPKVAQFRLDLQIISKRFSRFIGTRWSRVLIQKTTAFAFAAWELIFVSAVMQMGLALPMAYYFHRATTIALPANLVVVPMTQLMMPAAIAAVSIGYLSPLLAKLPVRLTSLALHGIVGSVGSLGVLRIADLRVAMPSHWMMMAAAGALIFAMCTARRKPIIASAGLVAILLASLILATVSPTPAVRAGALEMTAIDVGEGDSILIVTPQGKTLLVDAGGPIGPGTSQLDFGEDVVSPYLWNRGISHLDAVAITHGHSDHIGGMISVLKNFRPGELWIGLIPPSHALENVVSTAQALGIRVVRHWEGDEFEMGGATVRVLFPPRDWAVGEKPQNNDSMVLRVSYGESAVLLEGDAEKKAECRIAAIEHPEAQVLKVGHHGSANATTPELMAAVKPRFAVISVGTGNSFGLPRDETLAHIAAAGTQLYRTDLDGAVTFYLDKSVVTTSVAVLH